MLWLCHPNISQIRFINLLQKATCKGGFLINTLRYTSFHIANKSLYSVVLSSSTIVIGRLEKGDLVEKDILVRNMVSNLDSSRRQVKRKFIFFSEMTQNYLKKSTHKKGWFLRLNHPLISSSNLSFPQVPLWWGATRRCCSALHGCGLVYWPPRIHSKDQGYT